MILKKKIMASWAILSLSMIPILTIATGSTETTTTTSPSSTTKIPKVGHWQKAAGSKLTSGERGKFFQARNGDLYVMGKGTGLEVLKKGEAAFKPAPSSITRNGEFGTIFQARNGDLYVMGNGTRLEVLKDGAEEFEVVASSNISNGKEGTIFQVKNGDIYTMGIDRRLQVLKNGALAFADAPGSITTSGYEGHFFQAQNGDLYVGGWKTNLEVLKNGANQFAKASGSKATNGAGMRFLQTQNGDLYILHEKGLEVLKKGEAAFKTAPGSITTNGAFGIIFQARNGDIYVMGHNTKLEVLKNGATEFKIAYGSHINNGRDGNIFETWNGDIYAMGKGTGLEVLKKGTSTFVSAPGSKIQNGSYGQFFETQNGDLYVVSQYSTLEVLKFGANTFQRARGSKINTGLFAKIFQARNGDIYTMGYNAPLQVLKKGEDKFKAAPSSNIKNGRLGRFFQAQNGDIYAMGDSGLEVLKGEQLEFALTNETSSGNNDGQITLTNYKNQFSKLQYRKEGSATWDDVPSSGIISNLSPGLYEFQWVAKDGFQYDESTTSIEIIHEKQLIASAQVIDIPDLPTFTSKKETTSDANDGSITVTTFANADSQLQYRQTLIKDVWKDVPSLGQINDLSPGEYAFRWKSKNYQYYRGIASIVAVIEQKQMVVSADATNIPISPTFHKTDETIKGLNDGKIIVRNLLQKYPKLDFKAKRNKNTRYFYEDINPNGIIENLEIFNKKYYWFPVKSRMSYENPSKGWLFFDKDEIEHIFKPRLIDTEYDQEQNPTKYKVILKTYFEEDDHWLQYKKIDSSVSKWRNVLGSGIIDNLSPGTYQFRWKSKKMQIYEGTSQPTKLIEESFTISEGTNILVPSLPNFQVTSEATSGGNDGIITITNFINANSKLQYRREGTLTWVDVPPNGIIDSLSPGVYEFQWTSKNNSELYDETSSNTYALKKQVVLSYARKTDQVKAKIATDKALFVSFNPTLDAGVNRLNNGEVTKETLESLSGHGSLPEATAGVTRTYNINTNPDGLATVTATFTSGEFKDTANYEINNFKTIAQTNAEAKIATDKALFDTFNPTLDAGVNRLNNGVVTKETLESLSGHGSLPEATAGVTRTYNINTNPDGLATVTVTFTSSGFSATANYEINNFKTIAQTNAEAKIATDKALFDTFNPTLDAGVNRLNNGEVAKETLESLSGHGSLPEATAGVTRTYNINTNPAGLATVTVTFTSSGFTATANYEINNFKTIAQTNAEAKIATDKALFDTFNPTLDAGVNRLNNGEVTKETLESLSGHGSLPEATAGVTRTYNINTNPDGLATVTVTFTSGEFKDTANYEINNFKTIAQTNAEAKIATDKALFDTFNPTLDAGVNRLNNGEVTKETLESLSGHGSLPEATAGVTRTYNINTNPDGLATVTVTFTSGEFSATANYEINNFKTIAQTNAEAKIATDKALFDTFNPTLDAGVNRLNNGEVAKETLESLSGHGSLPEATAGVTRTYNINTNPAGLATVTVTFTSSGFSATANYEINNFKTIAQTNAEAKIATDKALFDTFNPTLDAGVNRLNNGEVAKETLESLSGHGSLPEATAGVTRTYNINTNPAGLATVTVTFTSSGFSAIANYEINNFKTIAQTNAEAKIATDKALFDTFNPTLDAGVNRLNNGEVTKETLESLSGHGSLPEATAGVTRTYNINTDPAGLATVTITFTSSGFSATANYEINNFKTIAQTNAEAKIATDKALFDTFNPTLDAGVNRLNNGEVTKETLESLSGHGSLPEATAGVTRTYNINTNPAGLATVTVTFTSSGFSATANYEINNFKTIAQTNAEAKIATDKALFDTFNPTLDAGVNRLNNGEVTKETLESLSGHGSLPEATAGVTRTYNINTDPAGLATVTVTFTSSGFSATANYEINNFKTIAQTNAEAKIATDKALFDTFNPTLDAGVNRLNNGEVTKETLEGLSGHGSLPEATAGVTRTYNINTNPAGLATVTVTFTSSGFSATANYEINNFKTIAQTNAEAKIATDKALFDTFNPTLDAGVNRLNNGEVTKETLESLSGHGSLPEATAGVTRTYNINTDPAGLATVTVTFTSSGFSATANYEINNFKTIAQTNAEAKIATDKALFDTFNPTLDAGVNRLNNGEVTKETLEGLSGHGSLPEATAGVTRTYNINTNPDGLATVTVTFTSSGFSATANYEINNFKTIAQTNAEGAIAKDKTVLSNFGNQNVMGKPDSLANGVANKETLENLNGHKKIPKAIANVNRAYRINTNLITGIATVTIDLTSGESPNQAFDTFTYTISGFKTQAEINETILETAVQALDVNGLNGKGDDTKLPSEISKATALSWIKALSSINGLADDVKNLLGEDDITLAFNDEEGILEITINNHGTPRTFRQISGFRVRTNSETLALVVQILDVNSFNGKGDSSKLPSEVKKATVLSWIKELSIINDLAKLIKDVKDLLLEDNIMLRSNDEEGSLVITINSHGDPKTFSKILGFKTNAKKAFEDTINVDKALFSDFDQTLTRRIEPLEDGVVTDLTLLTSNGHQALPSQTSGVSREFKIVRAATGSATMTVIFKAGTGLNQVSNTITYKINGFKVITFQDFSSSTTYSSLARNLKTITNEILEKDVKTEFEKINDYATYNNVDSSVKLLKVEVVASDETQRQVTYKLTYTVSGGIEKQKDIAITFALDLDADAKKFKDFISSAQHSELKSTINVASGDTPPNVQADFIKIPGYVRPANLSADLSIKSVIVKTPYNASTRQVVYVVTITNGKEDKSFDLTVTFKPDFALERVKFKNFNSNLGTYSEIAIAPKSGNDVKALFEKIDGYVIPQNLATGVKIHQVVVNVALNIVTRQVIYSIRLWDGKNIDTNEYGIVVTFAKDLDAGAHQLSSFTSSDNVKSLAALLPQNDNNVKTTFEAISGFARPQLSKNVKIAKVVVKKALDAITRKVTFTITLAKTNQNDANATPTAKTKDVIVTFAPSLDEEAKKFNDFVSSDNVKSKAALLAQNSNDVKTTFEAISGYTKPVLTSGVQMSKAIVKKALSDSKVIFTITLAYEGDRKTKDITVTFKELSKTKSEGLSTGAIVGIAIGSIAGLGMFGYLIYYLIKRK